MQACGLLAEAFFLLALCLAAAAQLAVAHAHLRGRDAFRKIVVVGCMSHACVGKTEKVRVVEVSDSQQRIDFFSFFSSQVAIVFQEVINK